MLVFKGLVEAMILFFSVSHTPEEPLIEMPRSHREDVDHIVFLLFQLLCRSSTCEPSERPKTNCFQESLHITEKQRMHTEQMESLIEGLTVK